MQRYANTEKSIPEIARELNVETVMEGSVQYAEGRVLVTAQLIDPSTNTHLWSESYDRELVGIFAIQADIAKRVTEATHALDQCVGEVKVLRFGHDRSLAGRPPSPASWAQCIPQESPDPG